MSVSRYFSITFVTPRRLETRLSLFPHLICEEIEDVENGRSVERLSKRFNFRILEMCEYLVSPAVFLPESKDNFPRTELLKFITYGIGCW